MSTGRTLPSKEQVEKYKTLGSSNINIFVNGSTHSFQATGYAGTRAFVSLDTFDENISIDYGGDLGRVSTS